MTESLLIEGLKLLLAKYKQERIVQANALTHATRKNESLSLKEVKDQFRQKKKKEKEKK